MFSKNEYIIYGSTGVCKIIDIVKKKFELIWKENITF